MHTAIHTLGFFNSLGTWDMVIILALGLLLFGRKLPDVGRSLGRGIVEFKKGLKGIDDEVDSAVSRPTLPKPTEAAYRAPLTGDRDVRVSRADSPEAPAAPSN